MAISAAKLEANRRNAEKSTGPRTADGKTRASLNAVTHGLRAETLVLLDEDPQELGDRKAAWRADLLPMGEAQERAVDDAVEYSWRLDRARRAQTARLCANVLDYRVAEDQTDAETAVELGQRLFKDRLGPLIHYPTGSNQGTYSSRFPSTSFAGKGDDPDQSAILVLRLQSTLAGCEWLLKEWAGLKEILERGQPWLPSDKLKAVRLLGRQPWDVIDDREVALVFLASFVLKPDASGWDWEILMELSDEDRKAFQQKAAIRALESLKPENAVRAREALLVLIAGAVARVTANAMAHCERAERKAALAADCLAFDESPAGERLRRYELANGRALARSLDTLLKLRRSQVSGPLSVVSGPLSDVSGQPCATSNDLESNDDMNGSRVPDFAHWTKLNEFVCSPLSVVIGPSSVVSGPLSVVNSPVEPIEEANATSEPTEAHENVTNEPTEGGSDGAAQRTKRVTDTGPETGDRDCPDLEAGLDLEKAGAWIRTEVANRRPIREEALRKLNEMRRREAEEIMAARRSRRGVPRNGKRQRTSPRVESMESSAGRSQTGARTPGIRNVECTSGT